MYSGSFSNDFLCGFLDSHNVSQSETLEVITVDTEEDAGELPVNDDEPLSKWIEQMHSPSMANFASKFSTGLYTSWPSSFSIV